MATETNNMKEIKGPILHVIVVGFHHKKGCQVEYSFPPLVEGCEPDSGTCPAGWKYLPTLALPDGSHNFDEDTVYFHLPSLTSPRETVYGISCFRQIPVERLKTRTSDITRGTVQKSVCVLSQLPLFGHIQVKMALITHAYFAEGDFSKVSLLHDTYHHLNGCLATTPPLTTNPPPPQLFVGLSARDLVLQFRHKALLLFKLLLLERRIVFYRSPVQPLCTTILSLLSLHPGMLETGLGESACVKPSRPMSPIPDFYEDGDIKPDESSLDEAASTTATEAEDANSGNSTAVNTPNDECDGMFPNSDQPHTDVDENDNSHSSTWYDKDSDTRIPVSDSLSSLLLNKDQAGVQGNTAHIDLAGAGNVAAASHVDARLCGAPLPIFSQGYLCHPYLSLPYLDLLSDVNVRGYVVGATNVLFKQKKQLADVLVEVESGKVETQEPELRRLLHLTTEDLRFADYVVRQVSEDRHDVFLDGVGWEGGDEWIRAQFRAYLLCLLRTSLLQDGSRESEHFNASFMSAWKDTHNYKMWVSGDHAAIWDVNPGHPFAGQLSVADMKLRLSHTMQNTEGGRKLNQAMASTGRAVATTGRAVGGALSQARGALSNWWSTLTTAPAGGTAADNSVVADTSEASGVANVVTTVEEGADALQTPGSATDMHRSPTVEQPVPATTVN